MSSEKLPVITDELIFALDQKFPNRHPDLSLTDREVSVSYTHLTLPTKRIV